MIPLFLSLGPSKPVVFTTCPFKKSLPAAGLGEKMVITRSNTNVLIVKIGK